jgi:hypothetical protein
VLGPGCASGGFEGIACYLERNHGWAHVTSPGCRIAEMNTFFSLMVFLGTSSRASR